MKKTLVALAALAAAGGAFAQSGNARAITGSGVEIFGIADARINYATSTNAGSISRLDNSGESSSRLGFRGVEDIGGGWGAGFWLEAGVGSDDGRGQNTTQNSTNNGQNLSVGTGANLPAAAAGSGTTQYNTASTSSLAGLQGLTFNRAAVVSLLNKGFGEIRAGRDYAPTFWNLTVYDPFGTVGMGSASNIALGTINPAGATVAPPGTTKPQVRTSNSIGWLSNDMGGFRAQVQYAFSEVPTNCAGQTTVNAANQSTGNSCPAAAGDGRYIGARLQYNSGPLSMALATGTTTYNALPTADAVAGLNAMNAVSLNPGGNRPHLGDYKVTNFGASYDAGSVKWFAQYGEQSQGAFTGITYTAATNTNALDAAITPEAKLKHYLLGATVPMNSWLFKATYGSGTRSQAAVNDRTQTQYALGAVYNFSKRTAAYGTYASITGTGLGTTVNQGTLTSTAVTATSGDVKGTGFDIGLRHSF